MGCSSAGAYHCAGHARCPEGKRSDTETAFGAHRHCTGRYQQIGTRECKPFSAHLAAPCRRYGDECQNRICDEQITFILSIYKPGTSADAPGLCFYKRFYTKIRPGHRRVSGALKTDAVFLLGQDPCKAGLMPQAEQGICTQTLCS